MLNPFVSLLSNVISIYSFVVIAAVILNLLIAFNIVNRFQPVVSKLNQVLQRLTEPVLQPIRKRLPDMGIDISPVILMLGLQFVDACLWHYLYNI